MTLLCAELQPLLDAECAAGNTIRDTGPAPGNPAATLVLLAQPFKTRPPRLEPPIRFSEINDPHWWLAEYGCAVHGTVLACAHP
jgi:hypothetical protein